MADRASVTVFTENFRAALQSVSVHASTDKDEPTEMLKQTRLVFDPDLITFTATNRFTAAMAVATVTEDHSRTGEQVAVQLAADQIKELLALFPGKDGSGESAVLTLLRLDVSDTHITAMDVTGLFPGKTMKWPRVATDDTFPDIARVIAGHLELAGTTTTTQLHTNGTLMALFRTPARLYNEPLIVEPTEKSALVVSCGEAFLGLLMTVTSDEKQLERERGWRREWERRLGIGELVPS